MKETELEREGASRYYEVEFLGKDGKVLGQNMDDEDSGADDRGADYQGGENEGPNDGN